MRKLWSAANVKVYGGGVSEVEFLSELSSSSGTTTCTPTSTSHGKGGRSTSHSTRRERILDVADSAALPKGRVVVLASGAPATLARTLPWMTGPHAGRGQGLDPGPRPRLSCHPLQRRRGRSPPCGAR
jgi:type IV secretory pathway TraG/TraD family ATPase VirD4